MDVNVADYGAVGNDISDDTLAFRNALNAIRNTGGNCFVPLGTYKIAPTGIMGNNNSPAIGHDMHLIGLASGGQVPNLHVHTKATDIIVSCLGRNWSIEKLAITMAGTYETDTAAAPIQVISGGSGNWTIDQCFIFNTGVYGINARGTKFSITNTFVQSLSYAAHTGAHPVHYGITVVNDGANQSSLGLMTGNTLSKVGILLSGNNHTVAGNSILQPGLQAGIWIPRGASSDIVIADNVVDGGQEGTSDLTGQFFQVSGIEAWSPRTVLLNNLSQDNCGHGYVLGGPRQVVVFNTAVSNGQDGGGGGHIHANGFQSSANASSRVNNSGSLYLGNLARDANAVGFKMQDYGLHVQNPGVTFASIIANDFYGNNISDGLYGSCQPNVPALVGRDLLNNMCDSWQIETIRSLFDPIYSITDAQYVILNQLLAGSSDPRP